jgi:hypothetical protein
MKGRGAHPRLFLRMIFYVLSGHPAFFEKSLSISEKYGPLYFSETVQRVKMSGAHRA